MPCLLHSVSRAVHSHSVQRAVLHSRLSFYAVPLGQSTSVWLPVLWFYVLWGGFKLKVIMNEAAVDILAWVLFCLTFWDHCISSCSCMKLYRDLMCVLARVPHGNVSQKHTALSQPRHWCWYNPCGRGSIVPSFICTSVCVCVWVYWVLTHFLGPCPVTFGILVPRPGIEPRATAGRVPNPNDCTTRQFPSSAHFYHACRCRHWTVPSPTAHEEHMSKLDHESHVDSNL